MKDTHEELVFYNPPGSSHTQMENAGYPAEENINLGMFIRGKKLGTNEYDNDFLVPGMAGFNEMRALIQLAGEEVRDYLKLRITWGELRGVLESCGVDMSQLVTRSW